MPNWSDVSQELSRWRSSGIRPVFWVRDDDAVSPTPQLDRLSALARLFDFKVGLGVIPSQLKPDLASVLRADALPVVPMCHGWRHLDHKTEPWPAEFGPHRPIDESRADLRQACERFVELLGETQPFFVPPFGQICSRAVAALAPIGFGGLSSQPSRLRSRVARLNASKPHLPSNFFGAGLADDGLNVQIDPIDWRRGSAKSDATVALAVLGELRARRKRHIDPAAPIGILTHHLVHDDAIWDVCTRLFEVLRGSGVAVFPELRPLADAHRFKALPRLPAAGLPWRRGTQNSAARAQIGK